MTAYKLRSILSRIACALAGYRVVVLHATGETFTHAAASFNECIEWARCYDLEPDILVLRYGREIARSYGDDMRAVMFLRANSNWAQR